MQFQEWLEMANQTMLDVARRRWLEEMDLIDAKWPYQWGSKDIGKTLKIKLPEEKK